MNEWHEYARRLASLPIDQQAAEVAKLSPDQRRYLEEARSALSNMSPQPKPERRKIWPWALGCGCLTLVALSVFFIVLGAGGLKEFEKIGREERLGRERQEAEQAASSAISISSLELVRQYAENEVAADQAYKGQFLIVDGTVENVGKDILGNMYVALEGPIISGRSVQCYFSESDAEALAGLSAGQTVKLLGRNEGMFGNIQLKNCRITE